jgi:beta-lactamase regulating signal transducer with metallopeptidase domain
MSENKTNTTKTTNKVVSKTNQKTWIIAGLAAFLILSVAGSVFYTMNQKTSNSQASSSSSITSKVKPKLCLVAGVEKPCPQPSRRPTIKPVQKSETNPYTGEKQ